MSIKYSFAPIASANARVLILGSMPGEASLAAQQYYAHPRNSFWYIIEQMFNIATPLDYRQRKQLILDKRIALWDVLRACVREGSLDSSIDSDTVVVNAFEDFFSEYEQITTVFFNGARAEKEFFKHVMPLPVVQARGLECLRLPSTSPAHAAMSREQKLEAWRLVAVKAGPQ
jgi:hypoxanthine-DNA glycosylase